MEFLREGLDSIRLTSDPNTRQCNSHGRAFLGGQSTGPNDLSGDVRKNKADDETDCGEDNPLPTVALTIRVSARMAILWWRPRRNAILAAQTDQSSKR